MSSLEKVLERLDLAVSKLEQTSSSLLQPPAEIDRQDLQEIHVLIDKALVLLASNASSKQAGQ